LAWLSLRHIIAYFRFSPLSYALFLPPFRHYSQLRQPPAEAFSCRFILLSPLLIAIHYAAAIAIFIFIILRHAIIISLLSSYYSH